MCANNPYYLARFKYLDFKFHAEIVPDYTEVLLEFLKYFSIYLLRGEKIPYTNSEVKSLPSFRLGRNGDLDEILILK